MDPLSMNPLSMNPLEDASSESDDLDMSWYHPDFQLDVREPMKDICIYFIYLNSRNVMEKIFMEKEILSSIRGISKERILKIIQTNRELPNSQNKYRFFDLLLFHVDIQPENIPRFSQPDNVSEGFFKVLPIFHDIVLEDSLRIFHSVNALYILFKENNKTNIPIYKPIKPILKKTKKKNDDDDEPGLKHNVTKKVGFSDEEPTLPVDLTKTRKKLPSDE